jgi:anti-anti-sigma factor
MKQLSISTGVQAGFQVLVVRGELDELTAPDLEAAINGHRNRNGWPLIIDLSNLEFISSAGLHILVRDASERLARVCPAGNIRRLFDIVRADRLIPIYSTLNIAIETLNQPEPDLLASNTPAHS